MAQACDGFENVIDWQVLNVFKIRHKSHKMCPSSNKVFFVCIDKASVARFEQAYVPVLKTHLV